MSNIETERLDLPDLALMIMALFLPPLPVAIKVGLHPHLLLSFVLTMFFFVPGVIHAIWIVLRGKV